MNGRRTIRVDYLARVEGEGALWIDLVDGHVEDVRLQIQEPPRFFEAFLRGRGHEEAPDITARICGICPVAYQMSACQAMEQAFGLELPDPIRALRRLLYCGEWIQSHALHIYFLHAPDFLGLESATELARTDAARLRTGMRLKQAGNAIMEVIGGRSVHPVTVRVGGFHALPDPERLRELVPKIEQARDLAEDTLHWVAGFDFPDYEQDYDFVALVDEARYPIEHGQIAGSWGLEIPVGDFETHFEEHQRPHSNALHSRSRARGAYLTGPLARYALNAQRLPAPLRALASSAGLGRVEHNPFRSIVVRALEVVYACDEALRLLATLPDDGPAAVDYRPRAAEGHGCTEAPRGILYHRYRIDEDGRIVEARIVPPTAQNQARIEADLRGVAERHAALDDAALQWRCEQAIRNYDPCISCATHFLRLHVRRR